MLKKRQVSSIDLIILSHPHLDHLGGLAQVAKSMPVRMFLDAGFPSTSPPYNNLLRVLAERGVAVKNATLGRNIDLGDGATLTLLGPPSPFLANTRSDVNANSVVARLQWRGRTVLFTGDAEPEAERFLLEQPGVTNVHEAGRCLQFEFDGGDDAQVQLVARLVAAGIPVLEIGAHSAGLEDLFIEITKGRVQ